MFNTCKSKKHCQVDTCQKRHQTLLHSEEIPVPNSPDKVDSNINNIIEKEILSQTYLQIVRATITAKDIEIHTNALLDTSSEATLIPKDIADKFKLSGIRKKTNILNAVTNKRKTSSEVVNFIKNTTD